METIQVAVGAVGTFSIKSPVYPLVNSSFHQFKRDFLYDWNQNNLTELYPLVKSYLYNGSRKKKIGEYFRKLVLEDKDFADRKQKYGYFDYHILSKI